LDLLPNSNFVASGQEERISVNGGMSKELAQKKMCDGMKSYLERVADNHPRFHGAGLETVHRNNLTCYFALREASFNMVGDGKRKVAVECLSLKMVRTCVGFE
jgi:hypothetical protein